MSDCQEIRRLKDAIQLKNDQITGLEDKIQNLKEILQTRTDQRDYWMKESKTAPTVQVWNRVRDAELEVTKLQNANDALRVNLKDESAAYDATAQRCIKYSRVIAELRRELAESKVATHDAKANAVRLSMANSVIREMANSFDSLKNYASQLDGDDD